MIARDELRELLTQTSPKVYADLARIVEGIGGQPHSDDILYLAVARYIMTSDDPVGLAKGLTCAGALFLVYVAEYQAQLGTPEPSATARAKGQTDD